MSVAASRSKGCGLRLVVDGIVYDFQKHGGINTYFNEILFRLSQRPGVGVTVLLPYHCQGKLPKMAAQIWREPLPTALGWSWRLNQVAKPLLHRANALVTRQRLRQGARTGRPWIFQSTYFTVSGEPFAEQV